jgi:hypothetical protein
MTVGGFVVVLKNQGLPMQRLEVKSTLTSMEWLTSQVHLIFTNLYITIESFQCQIIIVSTCHLMEIELKLHSS